MNSLLLFYCSCVLFPILISPSIAKTTATSSLPQPKTLILPVTKVPHFPRNQYVTVIKQRTPLVPIKLAVDLGLENSWVLCDHSYVSSTYKPQHCGSPQCSFASQYHTIEDCRDCFGGGTLNTPGCNNNTCIGDVHNFVANIISAGELFRDVASVESADGRAVYMPNLLFGCGDTMMMEGLASGVKGIAALGRTKLALPSQFAAAFGLEKKFTVCLSSSTTSNGVVLLGKTDVSKSLAYTPTLFEPSFGKRNGKYYIDLKSIKINDKVVPFPRKYLSFGYPYEYRGGTTLNTIYPYTVMFELIHSAFVNSFVEAMPKDVPRAADVSPFKACFNSTYIAKTPVGPAVPTVDFVMKNGVVWRMLGANTMVEVDKDVMCLAFVDYGEYSEGSAIVIGGHQLEDNLVQFDIANNRVGFSNSLLSKQTSCSNFAAKYVNA
ncbi:hypothetical protein FNV43_RR01367 [Rhamnella rubrinervis]|uniref:Peptidase A1 domain-containing protein n=1 Tax=Rhamnella rubrinervis TaxID=2594499 RepID=A0A8K0MSW4_9ROSA|nr:hypothetical protein FNV43_RR01367 [Rhamnella rubrinervis]